jgi:hypothetical protein
MPLNIMDNRGVALERQRFTWLRHRCAMTRQ